MSTSAIAPSDSEEAHLRLHACIERAAQLLPPQGPITSFAFLNTLQGLEHLPFDEGLRLGASLYHCQPYLPESSYWDFLQSGRIHREDLSAALLNDLADSASCLSYLGTRFQLRLAMLEHPLRQASAAELRWMVAETNAQKSFRVDVSDTYRARVIHDLRQWVQTEKETHSEANRHHGHSPGWEAARELLASFGEESIEQWSEKRWDAFCLQFLWRVCHQGVHAVRTPGLPHRPIVRHRDLLREVITEDPDQLVHDVLIRFCSTFVDQGFAQWALPQRELGFFQCFLNLFSTGSGIAGAWHRLLRNELVRLRNAHVTPLSSILESLQLLGVQQHEWDDFLLETLLALRGWAGMIWQLETRPDRAVVAVPAGTLLEFLAVRLVSERVALEHVARQELDFDEPLAHLRGALRARLPKHVPHDLNERVFGVFQLAQIRGWMPTELQRLSKQEWTNLVTEIEAFPSLERRRIYHIAFERRFRNQALDAMALHQRRTATSASPPLFQAMFCIDAREESFRRHLEEIYPEVQTFGTAGFFGVPIYYRGLTDATFTALCPIVVLPKHWVVEDVPYSLEAVNRRRARARRALGNASRSFRAGSQSFAGGALLTGGLGALASIPLVARVLFPRLTAKLQKTAERFLEPPAVTRLRLERTAVAPGEEDDQIGFTLEEMSGMSERALRDIGLTSGFSRLVLIMGHGSSCLNNPHESAYNCGACSGNAGGPNARAVASMLNNPRVREVLRERGLDIPDTTFFLGGLHNTCNDSLTFLDLDLIPRSHIRDFEAAKVILAKACERNAHERCRRFESAPSTLSLADALKHVEERSEDLAQTRPEYGNSTNALCVVGRRERTFGLYLDRRTFLMSYDSTQDDEQSTILARILSAVVPVCSGINLQYTLSAIDNRGWGCGTKLPHNVTSLLGVMDGAASDLRPGIPWQGLDIHEPMRLLFVIETTPNAMLQIMARNPGVGNILRNGWSQLAVLDPHSSELQVYSQGEFKRYEPEASSLPRAKSSIDWYLGRRGNLEFAVVGAAPDAAAETPATAPISTASSLAMASRS